MTTPIPGKKRVPVTLGDGVERYLVLDLGAFAYAEEVYGGSLLTDVKDAIGSFRGLRAILYGGLKRSDPSLTIEQLDDLLSMEGMQMIVGGLPELLNSALPKEDDIPKAGEVAVAPAS